MNQTLTAGRIGKDRYRLYDGITGCYLFVGNEKALLLDTGFGNVPLREKAEELTAGRPLILVNSHSHADHVMGNGQFSDVPTYIQTAGKDRIQGDDIREMKDGDVFDLGGITLEVMETPGHCPDCIVLADREDGALYTGDSVEMQHGVVRMLDEQVRTIEKIISLRADFDRYYPSHGDFPLSLGERLDALLRLLKKVQAGEAEGTPLHLVLPPDVDIQTFVYSENGIDFDYNPALSPWQ